MALPPEFAAGMFYNDLEPEDSKRWTALVKSHSAAWAYFRCIEKISYGC